MMADENVAPRGQGPQRSIVRVTRLVVVALIALSGCQDDAVDTPGEPGPADTGAVDGGSLDSRVDMGAGDAMNSPPGPTWYGDVRAVFEQHCVDCHRAGGVAPFDFTHRDADWVDAAPAWVGPAVDAIASGRMPPWMPDPDCRPLRYERIMDDDARAMVEAWRDVGYPVGDPAAYTAPPVVDSGDETPPDLVLRPVAPYVADGEQVDDYRCFPVAHDFERDTWVTRTRAMPDRGELVHHIVVYLIPPDGAAEVDARDADSATPGYRCFGDPVVYPASAFALWAPGGFDDPLPDGAAMLVPAGSRLVMQVHYNMANAGGDPMPDHSALALWTLPEGQLPSARIDVINFADLWLDIPADAAAHEGGHDFRLSGDGEIVAIAPHMHLLGERIRTELVRADGSTECLVDIPAWDFQWQSAYFFQADDPMPIAAGDTLRVRCTHDNSQAGQPIVDGEQRAPRDVRWGDGTYDEMCLAFAFIRRPVDDPYRPCDGAAECILECDADDADCVYRCMVAGGVSCLICAANEWTECAYDEGCQAEVVRMVGCINSTRPCGGGACVVDECLDASNAVLACSHALLVDGGCNDYTGYCGMTF